MSLFKYSRMTSQEESPSPAAKFLPLSLLFPQLFLKCYPKRVFSVLSHTFNSRPGGGCSELQCSNYSRQFSLSPHLIDINGSVRSWFPDADCDDVEQSCDHFSCIYLALQEMGRVNTSLGYCDTDKCWGFCECAELVSSSAFLTLCIFPFRRNPQETSVICSGLIKKQKHGGVLQKKTFWSSKWQKQPHNERCGDAMLYIWVSQRSIYALPQALWLFAAIIHELNRSAADFTFDGHKSFYDFGWWSRIVVTYEQVFQHWHEDVSIT